MPSKINYKEIKPPYFLNKHDNPASPSAPPGSMQTMNNYIPGNGGLETRKGLSVFYNLTTTEGVEATAQVTAIHRYYHDDTTNFSTATPAHECYVAVEAPSDSTSQTLFRLIYTAAAVTAARMLDAEDGLALVITGTTTGMFAQLNRKTYYTNYAHDVLQIRPRTSSGDTNSLNVHRAGIVDPSPELVICRCEDTSLWTAANCGTITKTTSPRHRLQGEAAVILSQTTSSRTATFTVTAICTDLATFLDGTTSSNSDFIALDVYRFAKNRIKELRLSLHTSTIDTTNYYECWICVCSTVTDVGTEAWKSYHPSQQTWNAIWQNNPYDNQMFKVRLRKSWFAKNGTISWATVKAARIHLRSDSATTASDPAQVAVDNIRLVRTSPVAVPFRLQMAAFEEQESGSTTGWWSMNTAAGTRASFSRLFAKEGCSCLIVSAGETCTLTFNTARDFSKFANGETANTSHILKMHCVWKGLAGVWTSSWTMPKVEFEDSSGNKRSTHFGLLASFLGGGTVQQKKFAPGVGAALGTGWTGAGTMSWDSIKKIRVSGLDNSTGLSPTPYYFDNLRLEVPEAMQPINVFEPIELIAIDTFWESFIEPWLKNFPMIAEHGDEIAKGIFSKMRYQTYGMGHMTYPDYEHSSIGIAGLRLTAYGSKTFGVTLKQTFDHDLTNYYIPTWQWPPVWNPPTSWGCVTFATISAGSSDYFQIWLASPAPQNVKEVKIKFHGKDGARNPDQQNYWEYVIDGSLLYSKIIDSISNDAKEGRGLTKEAEKKKKNYQEMIDRFNQGTPSQKLTDLQEIGRAYKNPSTSREVEDTVKDFISYLGRDRGGWPSATFRWRRRDMRQVQDTETSTMYTSVATPAFSAIRGISIEVVGNGSNCEVVVDNLIMVKEGALNGSYYYKLVLEDDEGNFSPSSEVSSKVVVDKKDIYLTDIYVPNVREQKRITNKRLYRLGGNSGEWRHVGDLDVNRTDYLDTKVEEDLGLVLPPDAYGPPRAKIMVPIGNNMYYGDVVDRLGYKRPYRVYKSESFIPFRVRDLDCVDLPMREGNSVTGICEYFNNVFLFSQQSCWTIEKTLSTPLKRADVGCIAHRTIAVSDYGVIWLSRDGLMLGNISKVNRDYFRNINNLFSSYTEDQLATAVGLVDGDYYYLFYDQSSKKGLVCYLPDGSCSELSNLGIQSMSRWSGRSDGNKIRCGDTTGRILTLFTATTTDNSTAITTDLRTFDYSDPGSHIYKHLKAVYVSTQRMGTLSAAFSLTAYYDQIATAIGTVTATTTTVTTLPQAVQQGVTGYHIGLHISGTNTHKISNIVLKTLYEEDTVG